VEIVSLNLIVIAFVVKIVVLNIKNSHICLLVHFNSFKINFLIIKCKGKTNVHH